MATMFLEVGNMDGFFLLIFLMMFSPAILFLIIGILLRRRGNKKGAKVFFILTGVYLLVSLGTCGVLLGAY